MSGHLFHCNLGRTDLPGISAISCDPMTSSGHLGRLKLPFIGVMKISDAAPLAPVAELPTVPQPGRAPGDEQGTAVLRTDHRYHHCRKHWLEVSKVSEREEEFIEFLFLLLCKWQGGSFNLELPSVQTLCLRKKSKKKTQKRPPHFVNPRCLSVRPTRPLPRRSQLQAAPGRSQSEEPFEAH